MNASFSSQLITLFIYDHDIEAAVKVFELFLLDGEKVLVDLMAGMIAHRKDEAMTFNDLELMTYLRRDMVKDCLSKMTILEILKHPTTRKPINVNLKFNSVEERLFEWHFTELYERTASLRKSSIKDLERERETKYR